MSEEREEYKVVETNEFETSPAIKKLKPCPFCGNLSNHSPKLFTFGAIFRAAVECGVCLACGPIVSSEKSQEDAERLAVALWDSRNG